MCGIAGIVNYNRNDFDYSTFCALGIANDRRGGDSTGIFIDGQVEYGIGLKAKFEDFFWESKLLNETTKCKIALVHDRKASVGGISLEKAHPILIKEPVKVPEGEESKEEIKFVLIHNGTIYNYEELAKKYIPDIKITGLSDSQVLALLLYYSGFDFLSEYIGGAAFVAVDYREKEPKVYLWRGESKRNQYATQAEEERPLFVNYSNGRLVFSSIASYLNVLDGDAYYLAANCVVSYYKGQLFIIKEIDRSKSAQSKYEVYTGRNNNTAGNKANNRTYNWPRDYYDGYDEDDTDWGQPNGTSRVSTPKWLTQDELMNRYTVDGKFLDGRILLTQWGRVCDDSEKQSWDPYEVWFYKGIALRDGRRAYKFIQKAQKICKLEENQFFIMYQNFIRFLSIDGIYMNGSYWYEAVEPLKRELYTGDFQQLGKNTKYSIEKGVKKINSYSGCEVTQAFWPITVEQRIDYKDLWKKFIQSIA